MTAVSVTIPKMLAELIQGERDLEVDGDTVGGALDDLCRHHPELRVHLFDESGGIRRHVRCFHNESLVSDLEVGVAAGDRITVLQAVSGGNQSGQPS